LTLVSANEIASLLGFSAAAKDDMLIVTAGRNKIQLVAGAAAAWLNVELVPLAAPCIQRNAQWFLESRSALKLFNALLSRSGKDESLQWGGEAPAAPSAPEAPPASVPRETPGPPLSPELPTVQPSPGSSASARPVLKGVRWGIEEEKIRAVMDFEGQGDPEIQRSTGSVKVFFAPSATSLSGLPSPYREVNVGSLNFGDRILLDFTSSLPVLEILLLDAPRRLVIDYRRGGASPPAPVKTPQLPDVPRPVSPTPVRSPARSGKRIVVVDPGHGGRDPGAVANRLREKDINLSVSRMLVAKLKELGMDARLTRDTDVYLTLRQRTDIANRMNADVFVSVHTNALPPGRSATGMEIYLMALPTDKDAMELARFENRELAEHNGDTDAAADKRTQMLLNILGNMQQNAKIHESTGFAEYLFNAGKTGGIKMRRVAQAPFYVLRGAAMPAVLVELGFLTDRQEARLLADKSYQQRMANALAQGIHEYLKNN